MTPRTKDGKFAKKLRAKDAMFLLTTYTLFVWLAGFALNVKMADIPAKMLPHYQSVRKYVKDPAPAPAVAVQAAPKPKVEEIPHTAVKTVSQPRTGLPTQSQKDATEIACAHSWEKHGGEMAEKNIPRALYMTTCYNDLLAIAYREGGFNDKASNESGIEHSYGTFQINRDVHPEITRAQAEDFVFAVNWTIERLHRYGYPVLRTVAIQCHNSCGAGNGYSLAVKQTADTFEKRKL